MQNLYSLNWNYDRSVNNCDHHIVFLGSTNHNNHLKNGNGKCILEYLQDVSYLMCHWQTTYLLNDGLSNNGDTLFASHTNILYVLLSIYHRINDQASRPYYLVKMYLTYHFRMNVQFSKNSLFCIWFRRYYKIFIEPALNILLRVHFLCRHVSLCHHGLPQYLYVINQHSFITYCESHFNRL